MPGFCRSHEHHPVAGSSEAVAASMRVATDSIPRLIVTQQSLNKVRRMMLFSPALQRTNGVPAACSWLCPRVQVSATTALVLTERRKVDL